LLVRVRGLLYREGYTIKGVQKLLSSNAGADISTLEDGNSGTAAMAQLHQALQILLETRADIGRMKDALGA
jgi:hypothetical protein